MNLFSKFNNPSIEELQKFLERPERYRDDHNEVIIEQLQAAFVNLTDSDQERIAKLYFLTPEVARKCLEFFMNHPETTTAYADGSDYFYLRNLAMTIVSTSRKTIFMVDLKRGDDFENYGKIKIFERFWSQKYEISCGDIKKIELNPEAGLAPLVM